jgi:hypothetical protein
MTAKGAAAKGRARKRGRVRVVGMMAGRTRRKRDYPVSCSSVCAGVRQTFFPGFAPPAFFFAVIRPRSSIPHLTGVPFPERHATQR